jgi:hypothetical protein
VIVRKAPARHSTATGSFFLICVSGCRLRDRRTSGEYGADAPTRHLNLRAAGFALLATLDAMRTDSFRGRPGCGGPRAPQSVSERVMVVFARRRSSWL